MKLSGPDPLLVSIESSASSTSVREKLISGKNDSECSSDSYIELWSVSFTYTLLKKFVNNSLIPRSQSDEIPLNDIFEGKELLSFFSAT